MENRVEESREFSMSAGRFALEMIFRYAWVWLLTVCAAALAGLIVGIIVDIRWLVVALMVVTIIMPMLLVFQYYYFGLRREAYVNTLPHTIIAGNDGLTLRLHLDPDVRDEFFPYAEMLPMRFGAKSAYIPLKAPAKGFIWIPADAYEDPDKMTCFLKSVDSNIHAALGITSPCADSAV